MPNKDTHSISCARVRAAFWDAVVRMIPASWWIGNHGRVRGRAFTLANAKAWYWAERVAGRIPGTKEYHRMPDFWGRLKP